MPFGLGRFPYGERSNLLFLLVLECYFVTLLLWHCFGCGKGGNVINFVMEMDNLSFPEAIKKLLKEKKNIDLKVNELRL
ncbi:MAG: hypothetical protein K6C10_12435, partial [Prevotella sp.]|nr:hypothetical protein [Prevotella sp.]